MCVCVVGKRGHSSSILKYVAGSRVIRLVFQCMWWGEGVRSPILGYVVKIGQTSLTLEYVVGEEEASLSYPEVCCEAQVSTLLSSVGVYGR